MQMLNKLPPALVLAAAKLRQGPIICSYRDGRAIRMETRDGINPYVWRGRNSRWQIMRQPGKLVP